MFGKVINCCHVPRPPTLKDTPRCSWVNCKKFLLKAPAAAVKLSPIAATTLMSPGVNLCTLDGLFLEGFRYLHGNMLSLPSKITHCLLSLCNKKMYWDFYFIAIHWVSSLTSENANWLNMVTPSLMKFMPELTLNVKLRNGGRLCWNCAKTILKNSKNIVLKKTAVLILPHDRPAAICATESCLLSLTVQWGGRIFVKSITTSPLFTFSAFGAF